MTRGLLTSFFMVCHLFFPQARIFQLGKFVTFLSTYACILHVYVLYVSKYLHIKNLYQFFKLVFDIIYTYI